MTKLKIWWLKRKIRNHYMRYMDIMDDYSCGHHMLQLVSGNAFYHASKFDEWVDKLSSIVDDVPKFRLLESNQ